jgi:exonuclease VII large subunit
MLWGIKDAFVGKSQEHEDEDEAIRRAHFALVEKMHNEALQQARRQRDLQRKLAADRLKDARDVEEKTVLALNAACNELSDSNYQLSEARANLEKAKGELELLSNKEIELVSLNPGSNE